MPWARLLQDVGMRNQTWCLACASKWRSRLNYPVVCVSDMHLFQTAASSALKTDLGSQHQPTVNPGKAGQRSKASGLRRVHGEHTKTTTSHAAATSPAWVISPETKDNVPVPETDRPKPSAH